MKINFFLTFISIALTGIWGYWIYEIAKGQENDLICGICSSICLLTTIIPAMGLKYDSGRIGANIRVLSFLFLIIFLISHFCFAIWGVIMPTYLIINGILLILYLAVFYKIANIKNI